MTTVTKPEEAVMGLATIFATADVMDPAKDVPTLRSALELLSTYMDEHEDIVSAMSWISGCLVSACELAAMGLRFGAQANNVELDEWIQFVARTLYSVVQDRQDGQP